MRTITAVGHALVKHVKGDEAESPENGKNRSPNRRMPWRSVSEHKVANQQRNHPGEENRPRQKRPVPSQAMDERPSPDRNGRNVKCRFRNRRPDKIKAKHREQAQGNSRKNAVHRT